MAGIQVVVGISNSRASVSGRAEAVLRIAARYGWSLVSIRLVVNRFVPQAVAFRVDAPREPFVRTFLMLVGARLLRHALHQHGLCLVRARPNSKVTGDNRPDDFTVVIAQPRHCRTVAGVDRESQDRFTIGNCTGCDANHSCSLEALRKSFESPFPSAVIQ